MNQEINNLHSNLLAEIAAAKVKMAARQEKTQRLIDAAEAMLQSIDRWLEMGITPTVVESEKQYADLFKAVHNLKSA